MLYRIKKKKKKKNKKLVDSKWYYSLKQSRTFYQFPKLTKLNFPFSLTKETEYLIKKTIILWKIPGAITQ